MQLSLEPAYTLRTDLRADTALSVRDTRSVATSGRISHGWRRAGRGSNKSGPGSCRLNFRTHRKPADETLCTLASFAPFLIGYVTACGSHNMAMQWLALSHSFAMRHTAVLATPTNGSSMHRIAGGRG